MSHFGCCCNNCGSDNITKEGNRFKCNDCNAEMALCFTAIEYKDMFDPGTEIYRKEIDY